MIQNPAIQGGGGDPEMVQLTILKSRHLSGVYYTDEKGVLETKAVEGTYMIPKNQIVLTPGDNVITVSGQVTRIPWVGDAYFVTGDFSVSG